MLKITCSTFQERIFLERDTIPDYIELEKMVLRKICYREAPNKL